MNLLLGLVTRFGTLDVIIVAFLSVGLVMGFVQGVMRQIFLLAAVYFGLVLAAQYYAVAADAVATAAPGGEPRGYSAAGLILVFVTTTLAINGLSYVVYRSARLPMLAAADRLGGAALGMLSAWVVVSLVLTAADFGLGMPIGGMGDTQREAMHLLRQSVLVPVVQKVMPTLYETLRPWVPTGLPAPFLT